MFLSSFLGLRPQLEGEVAVLFVFALLRGTPCTKAFVTVGLPVLLYPEGTMTAGVFPLARTGGDEREVTPFA